MSKLPTLSVLKLIIEKKSARFLVGTVISLSFSMAVILSTIGLMDGFEITLKKALSNANGDIKMTSDKGFYLFDQSLVDQVKEIEGVEAITPILQIESFAITDLGSKGVLIKGVVPNEFSSITGLNLEDLAGGIAIGAEFARSQEINVGDWVTLALASSKEKSQGVAILEDMKVQKIVTHGIFEKDLRFVYVPKKELEEILGYKEGVTNLSYLKIKYFSKIDETIELLRMRVAPQFRFEAYWSEFEVLLDAVEIEKQSISLMLQIIVLVAVLNIVAFIIYITEIKAQDFFMLRALGLSLNKLERFWYLVLIFIWILSAIVGYLFVQLFSYLVGVIPYLKIPGDIYVLSELKVILDPLDYVYVYGLSLVWVLVVGFILLKRLNKQSVIAGLRQEFS